jgi:GNAT superfamily N-acetyltransferase
VALDEAGRAAASCGVLPWPIRFGGQFELAAQLVDVATDRRHRRRGLFAALEEWARELCDSAGVSFLFAFPHPEGESYPGFTRSLGYEHIDDLVEYRLAIRTLWLERMARRLGPLHGLYERHLRETLRAYLPGNAVLENSLLSEGFAATDRTPEFHAYKAFAGSRVLAVNGGRVWLKVRRGMLLGDLEPHAEEAMDRTIRLLAQLAHRLGIHQVLIQASPTTRLAHCFERFRAFPCLTVVYRNLRSRIPAAKLRFSSGDLDNF